MKLAAVLLARAVAFFEVADLTPHGGLFGPDLVREAVQKFEFQKAPTSLDDWNSDGGAQFLGGRSGKSTIDKLSIWDGGILLETRNSTSESQRLLTEIIEWASSKFGFEFRPEIIKWAYVNSLTFYSDAPILFTAPLDKLAAKTSDELSKLLKEPIRYEPMAFLVGHDPLVRKYGRATFTLLRRTDAPFSDGKYFSEAPLPTDVHIRILEEYERDVMAAYGKK